MRFLIVAALLGGAHASAPPPLLREQVWTAPGPALAHDLTHAPRECVGALSREAEIGRSLFRAPGLLGGPAARVGLSCNACHSNGRVNARFLLPELTDRAGAADVTSEWASKARGDGAMNPRDIPDLAGVGERQTHGQHRDPSLEHFVHAVVEEEFQGQPPAPEAFAGLIAYLRSLDAHACAPGEVAIALGDATGDVDRAVRAAQGAAQGAGRSADGATARALLLAAQDAMGRIVERLPQSRFAHERGELERLSRELGSMREARDIGAALEAAGAGWNARFDAVAARLATRERSTYFNEATLRSALSQRS